MYLAALVAFSILYSSVRGVHIVTGENHETTPATTCSICDVTTKSGQRFPLLTGQNLTDPKDPCVKYHCYHNVERSTVQIQEIHMESSCEDIKRCENGKPPYRLPGVCCLGCYNLEFNVVKDSERPTDIPPPNTWSAWTEWTECSRSCGGGRQSRTRSCLTDNKLELDCSGKTGQVQDCNTNPCPVDGNWNDWTDWTDCSVTCGNGTQQRTRSCTDPAPQFGGNDCDGSHMEVRHCSTGHCPIDCEWLEWEDWQPCSVSCGNGRQSRKRFKRPQQFGGNPCTGKQFEGRTCNIKNCPIDGGWSDWSNWSNCSVTCGGGTKTRTRECNNPEPQFDGKDCSGENKEIRDCGQIPCPVDCKWKEWNNWSQCSVSCDGGTQTRTRDQTEALYGGKECVGGKNETRSCNTQECPNPCKPHPCYTGVDCHILSDTEFKCDDCPEGMRGNGINCTLVNECAEAQPCSSLTHCIDLKKGFLCTACPKGYEGDTVTGINLQDATTKKQVCADIDECSTGDHICDDMRNCRNLPGGYECEDCPNGYVNDGDYKCTLTNPCAVPSQHDCADKDYCINTDIGKYDCKCPRGMIGNGKECSDDSDSDGVPDTKLTIGCDRNVTHCNADNCKSVPNSGQEDTDGDGLGDACDSDMDNDGITNEDDNCLRKVNPKQRDGDKDGIGDECDNCPNVKNSDQNNIDGDEEGDACDNDKDGDGIPNRQDICDGVSSDYNAKDTDGDGVGDLCDNCIKRPNFLQEDSDQDGLGDACDYGRDRDDDGIDDSIDNCRGIPNADQLNTDGDRKGDACDNDDDNDGIPDNKDSCPLVRNPGDPSGTACADDSDGDGVPNSQDICPTNKLIQRTDFRQHIVVKLDPVGDSQVDPEWLFSDQGAEITQTKNSDPGMLLGNNRFSSVKYSGTFFIKRNDDNDYAGFVFNYQSNKRFVVVMWKKSNQTYWKSSPFVSQAYAGIQVKVVDSNKGPSTHLRNALWKTGDTNNMVNVRTIWYDKLFRGWEYDRAYRWELAYSAVTDTMRLRFYDGSQMLMDTNCLSGLGLKGGKLGVFAFSQEMVIWSDLQTRCLPNNGYDPMLEECTEN